MTRKATMNQLFNLLQDEYNIKSASDIEAVLLDMFGGFIEQALEAELDQHLGYSRYDFRNKSTSNTRNGRQSKTIQTRLGETRFRLPEIGKVHLNLKSCLNVKPMSSELKKRFYRFMLKVYQRVIFLKH